MTLAEYAALHPCKEMTEIEREISMLEGQMLEIDYRNDPAWSIRQDKAHNEKILRKIAELKERMEFTRLVLSQQKKAKRIFSSHCFIGMMSLRIRIKKQRE